MYITLRAVAAMSFFITAMLKHSQAMQTPTSVLGYWGLHGVLLGNPM
jgi:hypothetical protein